MRSGVHQTMADMIPGHGDNEKSLQSLYLTISDQNLLNAIDRMKFDGEDDDTPSPFSDHI
jgi:hypothetical protein